jgi:DNA topoisomerase I
MSKRGAQREKVLVTVVSLLDETLIRVGNGDYAKENGTYGLTRLRSNVATSTAQSYAFISRAKAVKPGGVA